MTYWHVRHDSERTLDSFVSLSKEAYIPSKEAYIPSIICETTRLLHACNDASSCVSSSCVTPLVHRPRMRMNLLTATLIIKRVVHSIERAVMTYWCDTYHSHHSSLMHDDELRTAAFLFERVLHSIKRALLLFKRAPHSIEGSLCLTC